MMTVNIAWHPMHELPFFGAYLFAHPVHGIVRAATYVDDDNYQCVIWCDPYGKQYKSDPDEFFGWAKLDFAPKADLV